jgi:hypothetical protein
MDNVLLCIVLICNIYLYRDFTGRGIGLFFLRDSGLPQYSARDMGFNLSAISGLEKEFKRDTGFGLYPVRDSGLKTFHATICFALFKKMVANELRAIY